MDTFAHDVRVACRTLLKQPGFTAIAILTLALGIGLNTSMFSVVNALLLRPLPYPDAERLVRVFGTSPESQRWDFTTPYAIDLLEQDPVFERTGLFAWWSATLAQPGEPAQPTSALRVSSDFLPTLAVQPALGRMFTPEEDVPGSNVAILMHTTWTTMFAADSAVIGRTVRLDGETATIVGVMPEHFAAPLIFGPVDLLRPLAITESERLSLDYRWLHVVGRLPPGSSRARAESALNVLAERFVREDPQRNAQTGMRVMSLQASGTHDAARSLTWLVLGISGFVLLIAGVNLANLQLVRALDRRRDIAVRSALGAPWARLIRSLATESVLLTVVGAGAGLLVAFWFSAWVASRFELADSSTLRIAIDARVLGFAAVATFVAAMVSGALPAVLNSRVRLTSSLKDDGRGTTTGVAANRLRHALVIGELALALMLLAGAGFFITGIERFVSRDLGWDADRVVYGAIDLSSMEFDDVEEINLFFEQVRDRAAALPGAEAAGVAWAMPIWEYFASRPIIVEDRTQRSGDAPPAAFVNGAMPGYFETLDIRLIEGRDFTARDDADAPRVGVINETMARAFWPDESAVGKRFAWSSADATTGPDWIEIVGVVNDVRFAANFATPPTPFQVYRPFAQETWGYANMAVRASGDPRSLVEPLRRLVAGLGPDLPVFDLSTVSAAVRDEIAKFRLIVRVLGGFALVGLVLAAIGIYGVIAHVVAQRTREISVRIALGAQVRDVLWLVLGVGVRLAAAGAVIGVAGSFALGRLLSSALPEIPMRGPWSTTIVTVALIGVALAACYLPARRATRVDPIAALRE